MNSQDYASKTHPVITPGTFALGFYLRAGYVGVALAATGIVAMFTSDTSMGEAALLLAAGVALAVLAVWRARSLMNGVDDAPVTSLSAADAERVLAPRAAAF